MHIHTHISSIYLSIHQSFIYLSTYTHTHKHKLHTHTHKVLFIALWWGGNSERGDHCEWKCLGKASSRETKFKPNVKDQLIRWGLSEPRWIKTHSHKQSYSWMYKGCFRETPYAFKHHIFNPQDAPCHLCLFVVFSRDLSKLRGKTLPPSVY